MVVQTIHESVAPERLRVRGQRQAAGPTRKLHLGRPRQESGPEDPGADPDPPEGPDAKAPQKTVQKGSRKVTISGEGRLSAIAYIDDKGDLVATPVPNVDKAIAILDGKKPNASTNPIVVELAKPDGTFRPIAIAFVDPTVFAPLPPPVAALGLDGLKRVDYRWGTRDTALYSVFRLVAPSPRRGIPALFDGPTFDKATLPPLPSGVDGFTVASISPSQLYDKLLAIVRQVAPDGEQQVAAMQAQVNQMVGVKVREDLLAKLGPKWSMYAQSPATAPGGTPFNVVALTDLSDPRSSPGSLGKAPGLRQRAMIKAQRRAECGKDAPTPRSSRSWPGRSPATRWSSRPARSLPARWPRSGRRS